MNKYREYKQLDLVALAADVLSDWETEKTFEQSISARSGSEAFTFYEGPPSANGMPGIHHVMGRAIKDIFCRYKTQKGYIVNRKGGWDTHGLPIELAVEKSLGITKEDIGKKISVDDYNHACRKEVMKYKNVWDDLTRKMGYWVDLENPYITFENYYIESCWYLLSLLYKKGLLYKGYTIQPYSPAAGTGLSSHEINQPGTYKNVKDTTVVAQFRLLHNAENDAFINDIKKLAGNTDADIFMLAWTTTPWTLPSNTALAVGEKISYDIILTYNVYTTQPVIVILASALVANYFNEQNAALNFESYKSGDKQIPYRILLSITGAQLAGMRYEQLLPYAQPETGDAFKIIPGDFVTTQDGTGIVHIAPSFGADDFRVARQHGIGSLTLVDKQGKFIDTVTDFAGRYVKNYNDQPDSEYVSVDVDIAVKLKTSNRAFKIEKYEHTYPHCWRTDKPILYYPLDSWFIKASACKERMAELNKTINWKPEHTGTGRFGEWLNNLQDWNLSRSRYWGVPLPIWRTDDASEEICICNLEQLHAEINKSVAEGFMTSNPFPEQVTKENKDSFDLHRPYIDDIILVSPSGKPMKRELDLIDVWFDSGAMPYAQFHYLGNNALLPFSKGNDSSRAFPADFIAEGVDQTRGWFYTLHAIGTMVFDSVAFKNVVSNGLVLDKNGNKMSKRLGNAVDPFETLAKYGPDATRWYMISNANPWENLKFNAEGIVEIQRKFFGTLHNTYSFFALYANIDNFTYKEKDVPLAFRQEIDRWIISLLNSLIMDVDAAYNDYEPTKATRIIQDFVCDHLSNWYVRLCRRRFWKGDYTEDKIAAYQTLYTCLETVARLIAPVSPFYAEVLYRNLNSVTNRDGQKSVHIAYFPKGNNEWIDSDLEQRMHMAQDISSLVLSLRKKVSIRVRQPLQKILLPVSDGKMQQQVELIKNLVLTEVNVKQLEYLTDTLGILKKKAKANFKVLGKKAGAAMKDLAALIQQMDSGEIADFEKNGKYNFTVNNQIFELNAEDIEVVSEDIPGWQVATDGRLTVALDISITEELQNEGIARELINRLQNIRKESDFDVTDKINVRINANDTVKKAIEMNKVYICTEILAASLEFLPVESLESAVSIELDENTTAAVSVTKA